MLLFQAETWLIPGIMKARKNIFEYIGCSCLLESHCLPFKISLVQTENLASGDYHCPLPNGWEDNELKSQLWHKEHLERDNIGFKWEWELIYGDATWLLYKWDYAYDFKRIIWNSGQ